MNNDIGAILARADANISALQRSRALLLDQLSDGDAAAREHAHIGTSSALPLRDAFTIADCERMARTPGDQALLDWGYKRAERTDYKQVVHHIDGDPTNNELDNLRLMDDDEPYRNWPMNWDTTAERNGDR